jgi:hypothetical protein
MAASERVGMTSRIRRGPGRRRTWHISPEHSFPLPVIVDHMFVDPDTGELGWRIEATIDLVDGDVDTARVHRRLERTCGRVEEGEGDIDADRRVERTRGRIDQRHPQLDAARARETDAIVSSEIERALASNR